MITRHAVGPRYAGVVVAGGTAYIAGQIADSPDAGVRVQAAEVLGKLDHLLAQVGSTRKQLLSLTVWLADFDDYQHWNEVYDEWIDPAHKPARATVRAELFDPRLRIEIAGVALAPAPAEASTTIDFLDAEAAIGRLGDEDLLFVDVRERHEYESGHVPGSLHASRGMLEFHLDPAGPDHVPELVSGRTLVMVCGSGQRAQLSARLAAECGHSSVCLRGGMRSWRKAGGPVE